MIVLWESEAHARRPLSGYGGAFRKAPAALASICTGGQQGGVWELKARVWRWSREDDRVPSSLPLRADEVIQ